MVYVRDVAQVRDGNAPQTNIVHVNGDRSVLLQVLKNGSASTLAIIAGVKRKLAEIADALPTGLQVSLLGDQSLFVRAAISQRRARGRHRRGADQPDDPAVPRQRGARP